MPIDDFYSDFRKNYNRYFVKLHNQWVEILRQKNVSENSHFYFLGVLAVILAHRNEKTGFASPSIERIAIMLGTSKARVLEEVENLKSRNWLTYTRKKTRLGREFFEYKIIVKDETPLFVSAGMFTSGAWAFLTPAAQKLWWLLRGYATHGLGCMDRGYSVWGGSDYEETLTLAEDIELRNGWDWRDFWYIPANIWDTADFARRAGVVPRTINEALKELNSKGFVYDVSAIVTDENICPAAGYALPVRPMPPCTDDFCHYLKHFQHRLADIKVKADTAVNAASKRKLKRMLPPCTTPPKARLDEDVKKMDF